MHKFLALLFLLCAFQLLMAPASIHADENHVDLKKQAVAYFDQGTALYNQAKYQAAMTAFESAIAIDKQLMPTDKNWAAINSATNLLGYGSVYQALGQYSTAESAIKLAVKIYKHMRGVDHPDYALGLNNLAALYHDMGLYSKAQPLLEQALKIRKVALGIEHPLYGTTLNNLATSYLSSGLYEKALPLYQQALLISSEANGVGHASYAGVLNNLAELYRHMGLYAKALPLQKQSLVIKKKTLGENHPDYALALNNLATLYMSMGVYAKALPLYEQSLAIWKRMFGENHPDYALALNNIAQLYVKIGSYAKALPLYKQALVIWRNALGDDHPSYATGLNNLAFAYASMGDDSKALSLYKQALVIWKRTLGEEHPGYAQSLHNIADLYRSMGEVSKALPLQQQALELMKHVLGEDHPDYSTAVNNLASTYISIGSYTHGVTLYEQVLSIRKKSLGEEHPLIARVQLNLAAVYASKNKDKIALQYFIQAQSIVDKNIESVFYIATEKQKIQFVQEQQGGYHAMLSLIHKRFADNQHALHAGLNLVLSRKSIVFDAQARQQEAIANSLDPKTKKLWTQQAEERSYLSVLIQNKPKGMSTKAYKARITSLQGAIAKLERALTSKSALIAQQLKQRTITAQKLAGKLGKDSVLAEFVRIQDYDWKEGRWTGTFRYLVFVLNHAGSVHLIDLGDAEELESEVHGALKSLSMIGADSALQIEASRSLYEVIWKPVAKAVGHATSVIVSPDGLLNLVAFNAMRNSNGHYLIELKQITYVTSGRDLAKSIIGIKPEQDLYLVANPDFSLATPSISAGISVPSSTRSVGFSMQFTQLPGTEDEAKTVPSLLHGKQTIVTGKSATESSVLLAKSSKVIHIATHGFFLHDQPSLMSNDTRGFELQVQNNPLLAPKLPKGYENPMVRSGLALAGANHARNANGATDGLLTALEVSSLNLHATQLVTLSACETGSGDIKTGEGVYGLRRAFSLAGAQYLVMSLWSVGDAITATQMRSFYQAYGMGVSPPEAMRSAQLATIKALRNKKGFAAPALWAPFIVQLNYGSKKVLVGDNSAQTTSVSLKNEQHSEK